MAAALRGATLTRRCPLSSLLNNASMSTRLFSASSASGSKGGFLHHEYVVDGKILKGGEEGLADGRETVLFLHGLLGAGKNLRAPAKKLTEMQPHLSALLLDLRGHGSTSANATLGAEVAADGPHSFEDCVGDIFRTLHRLGLVEKGGEPGKSPVGVVGHSFGGRIALQYLHSLLHRPSSAAGPSIRPPRSTWLLDTVPGIAHGSVAGVVEAVSGVRMPVDSKKALVEELTQRRGVDKAIAMWMTTNLSPVNKTGGSGKGGFDFDFDLNVVRDVLEDFPRQDFVGLLREVGERHAEQRSSTLGGGTELSRVSLVMAGKNSAWTEQVRFEVEELVRNGHHMDTHVLEKAGHWVHVDDLEGLMALMKQPSGGFNS